jgi:hypothetical protein
MALKPHIYHIVGHTEAHHAATADDIIEASKIVRRVISNALGAPDMCSASEVQLRKKDLLAEAAVILGAIRHIGIRNVDDPWTDAATLARAVTTGILDAPQLKNNKFARGQIRTRIMDGACIVVDENNRKLEGTNWLAKIL